MIVVVLSGAGGRMGQAIRELAEDDADLQIRPWGDADSGGDVLIDFSHPDRTAVCLDRAVAAGMPIVIGTTGIDERLQSSIRTAARSIPVCRSANFSLGVNLLIELVEQAARVLPATFDIEISELHHRWKADAPSGTALMLAQAAARGRGLDPSCARIRSDGGPREAGEIGIQVARGGDVAGEHVVRLLGDGERLELVHRAGNRSLFARGALLAARWLIGQPPGLYDMRDVIRDLHPTGRG
ncbi:MAG: 4-hydroxy-tetrahydrodipicolinate reductase [Wenzhouxiangellaceae bacterium]